MNSGFLYSWTTVKSKKMTLQKKKKIFKQVEKQPVLLLENLEWNRSVQDYTELEKYFFQLNSAFNLIGRVDSVRCWMLPVWIFGYLMLLVTDHLWNWFTNLVIERVNTKEYLFIPRNVKIYEVFFMLDKFPVTCAKINKRRLNS